ncbi:cytochrome c3 family protein [Neobacillus niacini]|uniref:cytochrome c3 family protein n=1 Tax=Neobacillus niacini TaxID=86668 RepID=UPI00204269EA|nr:cytochrome c3 family protein [Neobacillus niacini]MCM3691736.1 cytochrome c3 family protein [Neobacillus niacini]
MNFKRKLIACIVIWSVIFGSLLSYSPETQVFSATGVPELTLITPVREAVLEVSKVELNARISDDLTAPDKLLVKIFEHTNDSEQPIDITNVGTLNLNSKEQYAEFFYTKEFSEGVHKLTFVVTDGDGLSTSLETSFTVQLSVNDQKIESPVSTENTDTTSTQSSTGGIESTENSVVTSALGVTNISTRAYMVNMYLIPQGSEDQYQADNDKVPNSYLLAEDMTRVPLDYKILLDIRSAEAFNPTQPLITIFGDSTGKEKLVKTIDLDGGIKSYIYTFTPDKELLDPAKSYFVYLNPNLLVPRFLKFTTVGANYESYQFEGAKGNEVREKDYIHGPYSIVTNTCAFCHSTHNGSNLTLEGGKFGTDTNNLCMACHDGTNGSPKLETSTSTNKHNQDSSVSCSSCHDPHNPGTKENPNSFHPNKADDANINPFLTYKKASTATGETNDFSLCFSCHNGIAKDKNGNLISNIEKYYKDETYTAQSGHNITATNDSGSQLNGQIPCAECHETHGSKNIKMLRGNLGNIKLDDTNLLYESKSENWDATEERNFCLKCHNNTTEIYGKTGSLKNKNDAGETIIGHQADDVQSCSSCHGGETKSYIDAAHAPTKGIHVPKQIIP